MIQAEAARNRGGPGERPHRSRVPGWIGPQTANSSSSPAMRRTARALRRLPPGLAVAGERDAVQLHPVVDEAEAEFLRDALLQRFELVVDELDDIAGLDVDQMIV